MNRRLLLVIPVIFLFVIGWTLYVEGDRPQKEETVEEGGFALKCPLFDRCWDACSSCDDVEDYLQFKNPKQQAETFAREYCFNERRE